MDSQKTLMELTPMQPSQEVTRLSQDALTSMNHLKANLSPAQTGLISVIIPAYNGGKYIAQAVESVLNQTYPYYEILLVDDGSTDNTRAVLEPYFDRIQYVYQDNQGVAAARNRGIEMARGEFVAFLDQDDFFLSHKLALQVACFELQPNLGIVHSGWRRVNATGEKIADAQLWKDVPNLDLEGWVRWRCVLLSAMMFRREWLERVGGLDPQFKQTDDTDLILRLSVMGCQTAWVRQSVVCYREHEGNASRNIQGQAKENLAVLDKFFASIDLPEHIQPLENHCRYYTTIWIAWRFYSAGLFSQMAEYLKQSLNYRGNEVRDMETTELNWIETFAGISARQEEDFEVKSLEKCLEWRQLKIELELKQLKTQFSQVQEKLERSKKEVHQKNEELAQTKAELQEVRNQSEQVQSQLRETTEKLDQTHTEVQKQTQELEQSQVQLHQKNADLEQYQSLLHQTEEVLEQSQTQLHETEKVLEQSVEELKRIREKAHQFESQLHHTQEELKRSQAQLNPMTQERDRYQSQLHQTQEELEQSQSKLYEMTQERDHYQSQLHQTQEELEQSQSKLYEMTQERDRYQSQFHQTQEELEQSQSKLYEMTQERERYQSQFHQTQEELEQSQSQLQQTQEELALMQTEKDWLDSQVLAWMQTAEQVQEQFERENSWLKAQSQAWMQAAQQCHATSQ